MTTTTKIPTALTIAGSDSGGGAGIQADIKTMSALQVYSTSVLTSITSQNTLGVDGIHQLPPEFVQQQLRAVLSDIGANAIKTGMLSSSSIISAVVATLKEFPEDSRYLVVDPVMVSTSGSRLLPQDAVQACIQELLPITYILTPNVPEAQVLLSSSTDQQQENLTIQSVDDMHTAAKKLASYGPRFVLLKGGHLPQIRHGSRCVVDVLYDKSTDRITELVNHYIDTPNTHGTGCTLSAAIASELAKGIEPYEAIKKATTYIQDAIATSMESVGKGSGPVNHFHNLRWMPYTGKSFVQALRDALPEGLWSEFIDHPFVRGMADGTLPREAFIHYIKQDYLYLVNYARSAALAAYKSKDIDMCAANAKIVLHIHHEMQLHLEYCEQWGISKEEVLSTPESVYNIAYTRFVLDKGASGDQMDLQVAMAPCLLGYGDIGMKLFNDPNTKREGNPYWKWISNYAQDDYQTAVKVGKELMEELAIHCVSTSPTRFREVCDIFEQATRLEIQFWEMGLNQN
ncbi:Phosphomethylpyrimidine kinase-domain-containing protein [Halteromyces radiatus]|uniref:Phosphomethylpyrimidine kinase-domain-containing protein n=1 Tax=Halteromyces radiatus TaxID=101107 RepID=UPI002220CD26|nr:Phosphomethylpyrimidine kinase-domain-containing protein [Halteromyces radiatus]KAI8086455.1 Phosphomethylpyrimidine kinase-domain-containing protein [Halteromyces radiatus]